MRCYPLSGQYTPQHAPPQAPSAGIKAIMIWTSRIAGTFLITAVPLLGLLCRQYQRRYAAFLAALTLTCPLKRVGSQTIILRHQPRLAVGIIESARINGLPIELFAVSLVSGWRPKTFTWRLPAHSGITMSPRTWLYPDRLITRSSM